MEKSTPSMVKDILTNPIYVKSSNLTHQYFELNDIKTIYLPNESYHDRFMEEFPGYIGEFYYLDN